MFDEKQKSVLIIEDDKNIGKLMKRILERDKYKVTLSETGEEAIDFLKKDYNIDMIIFDLHLPKISGYDLFLAIKKQRPETKILITSGMLDDNELERLLLDGKINFLQKPYDNNTFLETVRKYINMPQNYSDDNFTLER